MAANCYKAIIVLEVFCYPSVMLYSMEAKNNDRSHSQKNSSGHHLKESLLFGKHRPLPFPDEHYDDFRCYPCESTDPLAERYNTQTVSEQKHRGHE